MAIGKEGWRQPQQVIEKAAAQTREQLGAGGVDQVDLREAQESAHCEQPEQHQQDAVELRHVALDQCRVENVASEARGHERDRRDADDDGARNNFV